MLDIAISIAAHAHLGQVDKAGRPYILHPLRVMSAMDTDEQRIVAVLHDVVEDSEWTLTALEDAGFSAHIISALDALTKREGEDYHVFTQRVAHSDLATAVKSADLRDNMDITRLSHPLNDKDFERLAKYRRALSYLTPHEPPNPAESI